MKKIFFSLAMMAILPLAMNAQEKLKPTTSEEVTAVFCHQWKLAALQEGKTRLPPPFNVNFFYITLKSDGTFTKTTPQREEISGTWQYFPKNMLLKIEDPSGVSSLMLSYITEKEFVYKTKAGPDGMLLVYERLL